jgi:hypothetical protein
MFFDCLPLKTELIGCTETSPDNHKGTLRSIPEEERLPLHSGVSLELRMLGTAVSKCVTNTFEEPLLGMQGVNM